MTVVVGELLAGKYHIERELGRGGMGAVFLAENTAIGRKVAIKVLLPEAAAEEGLVERFRQEARAAAAIGHPGIVDVLDLGRSEAGDEFIVMEYLRGESLRDWLEREEELSVHATIETMLPLIDALAAAHARGIVHRDLKPDNIFITSEPARTVKILDFGISKLMTRNADEALTATGAVMGTPYYMPPEQARGKRELGPAADIYALGAIIYRVLAGEPMFSGTLTEVLLDLINTKPPQLKEARPDVPDALSQLVDDLVAKESAARPSLDVIKSRLAEILAQLPESEPNKESDPEADTGRGKLGHKPITPVRGPLSPDIGEERTITPAQLEADDDVILPPPERDAARDAKRDTERDAESTRMAAAEITSRRPLYAAIGVAALAGLSAVVWIATRPAGHVSQAADQGVTARAVDAAAAAPKATDAAPSAPELDASAARDAAQPLLSKPDMSREPRHKTKTRRNPRLQPRTKKTPKTKTKSKVPAKVTTPKNNVGQDENPFDKPKKKPDTP
ncbi:MAG: serine/threonine protein kinase [Myxococcales bacterium]|nr:serine/threonine protein kinase [Myxococcales bacterium]